MCSFLNTSCELASKIREKNDAIFVEIWRQLCNLSVIHIFGKNVKGNVKVIQSAFAVYHTFIKHASCI